MFTRKLLKVLHTLGSLGITGGVLAYLLLVGTGTPLAISPEYVALRDAIYAASRWVIMPSMLVTLASGLLAMAVHHPFQNMLWVWLKALTGLLVFEAVLASVDGPARRAASAARAALDGELDLPELEAAVHDHVTALWILLGLFALNVVLGVFRPRFRKKLSRREPASRALTEKYSESEA